MKEAFLIPESWPWNTLVKVSYLIDYQPVTVTIDGKTDLNPLQDKVSKDFYIFFKKNGYPQAIERFRDLINNDFDPAWEHCVWACIPSHDPDRKIGDIPSYKLLLELYKSHPEITCAPYLLVRTELVQPRHKGGNRSIKTQLKSIGLYNNANLSGKDIISGKDVVLFDDILTTGNSVRACVSILKDAGARRVFVLVLGKTVPSEDFGSDPYIPTSYRDAIRALSYLEGVKGRLQLREEMLELTREDLGERHPDTILAMGCLASGLEKSGKKEEAEQLRKEMMFLMSEIRKEKGDMHPDTVSVMECVASDLEKSGKSKEALQLRRDILSSARLANKKELEIISAMEKLVKGLREAGETGEAEQLQKEMVSLAKAAYVKENPETVPVMKQLEEDLQKLHNFRPAMQLRGALNRWLLAKAVSGAGDQETVSARQSLKSILSEVGVSMEGNPEIVLELRKDILSMSRLVYGSKGPETISAMKQLASGLEKSGESRESLQLRKDIFSLSRVVYGEEEPETLLAIKQLEEGLREAGEDGELLNFYEDVLSLKNDALKKVIPKMLIDLHRTANNLIDAGEGEKAVAFRRKILARCKESLGDDNLDTLMSVKQLAIALEKTGNPDEAAAVEKEMNAAFKKRMNRIGKPGSAT